MQDKYLFLEPQNLWGMLDNAEWTDSYIFLKKLAYFQQIKDFVTVFMGLFKEGWWFVSFALEARPLEY